MAFLKSCVAIALIVLTSHRLRFAEADPIEETLIQSKKQYDSSIEKVRESVLAALEKKYTALMKSGDLKGLEAVEADIQAFKENGQWPQSIPTKGFESQVTLARKRVEKAFEESKAQYTKAGNIELAKAVQKELEEFKLDQTLGLSDRGVMPALDAKAWMTQPSGLKLWDVKAGKGRAAGPTDTVIVYFTGWLIDGTVFDKSKSRENPTELSLNKAINGWKEGVTGMKPGSIHRLLVPADLAYGKNGAGKVIPPNSMLVFQIELIDIK